MCVECGMFKFFFLFLRTSMGDLSFVMSCAGELKFFSFHFFKEPVEDLFSVR